MIVKKLLKKIVDKTFENGNGYSKCKMLKLPLFLRSLAVGN